MTAVDVTFILQAQIGFNLPVTPSNIASVIIAIVAFVVFTIKSLSLRYDE